MPYGGLQRERGGGEGRGGLVSLIRIANDARTETECLNFTMVWQPYFQWYPQCSAVYQLLLDIIGWSKSSNGITSRVFSSYQEPPQRDSGVIITNLNCSTE